MDLADRLVLFERVLRRGQYRAHAEAVLQVDLAEHLTQEGWDYEREVLLSPEDRIDFLVEDGIGLEVKVKGRMSEVWRQVARYASSPRISAVVLFTTRAQLAVMPGSMHDKPIRNLYLPSF